MANERFNNNKSMLQDNKSMLQDFLFRWRNIHTQKKASCGVVQGFWCNQ